MIHKLNIMKNIIYRGVEIQVSKFPKTSSESECFYQATAFDEALISNGRSVVGKQHTWMCWETEAEAVCDIKKQIDVLASVNTKQQLLKHIVEDAIVSYDYEDHAISTSFISFLLECYEKNRQ